MTEPDTNTSPLAKPEARSVPKYEFLTIVGSILALGALLLTTTGRIEARLDSATAEAAADRRASDAKMDEFRAHMQRLGERQARLEGRREGAARQ